MNDLFNKIENALSLCKIELQKTEVYPYLPDIIKILDKMKSMATNGADNDLKERIAGGLGRIVTEDYSFAVSELGMFLLEIADQFAPAQNGRE